MASYKSLKVLFHETNRGAETVAQAEHERRLANPATVKYPYFVGKHALFAVLCREIYEQSEGIWLAESLIQEAWNKLPSAARAHYFYTLLVEEIQSTNEIENIQSTRREVTEALDAALQGSNHEPRKRFQEMASTFRLLIGDEDSETIEFPRTLEELRTLYDQLLGAEIASEDKLDGELFRLKEVYVSDGSKSIHKGINGEDEIKSRLSIMLEVSHDDNLPRLVNAFVAHLMLEHTHPFYDGNGRFGRFLLALRLRKILSTPTALSLSAEVMRQKEKYYKAFVDVEEPLNKAEATFFVADMLSMLFAAQMRLVESLSTRLRSLSTLSDRINELQETKEGLTEYQHKALFLLGQILLFGPRSGGTLDEISEFLDRSKNTVRPDLKDLVEKGLIKEIGKRPIVYSLTEQGEAFLHLERP